MQFQFNEELLKTVLGSFSPNQMSIYLNKDEATPYSTKELLTLFHERFHYFQYIFTPYGHLKWSCNRSATADIIELWRTATSYNSEQRRVPIKFILEDTNFLAFPFIGEIWMQELILKFLRLMETSYHDNEVKNYLLKDIDSIAPQVTIEGELYYLDGIDILEGFTKYQEAQYAYIIEHIPMHEIINPDKLNKEYYITLQYFLQELGPDRICDFPAICELALCNYHINIFKDPQKWKSIHPGWRFVKLVSSIRKNESLFNLNYKNIEKTFVSECDSLLNYCGFEISNTYWNSAIEYANQAELNMSTEMLNSIQFKNKYPIALSYPFSLPPKIFKKLMNFQPYYYTYKDVTVYNAKTDNPQSWLSELAFENNFQALANQIVGNMSQFCINRNKLQCGFSYYGLRNGCKYYENGSCDGSIDSADPLVQNIKLNENLDLVEGCMFELFFKAMDLSLNQVIIGDIYQKVTLKEISEYAKSKLPNKSI